MVFETSSIFLLIFVVSLGLTLLSFALGIADVSIGGRGVGHGHIDTPHGLHLDHGHLDVGHDVHLGHAHGGHDGAHAASGHHAGAEGISPFNMATMLAFLTWFGGAGYLLTGYFGLLTVMAILLAAAIGLVGAAVVFTFMVRVLLPGQTPYLRAEDYELTGTIGRLTVGIREGGTGELVYSKGGARRVVGARSEDGTAIERGVEVVVVRYENAIAYVEPFDKFFGQKSSEAAAQ